MQAWRGEEYSGLDTAPGLDQPQASEEKCSGSGQQLLPGGKNQMEFAGSIPSTGLRNA